MKSSINLTVVYKSKTPGKFSRKVVNEMLQEALRSRL